ncbi:MAG TPA: universal stress protein [Nitrososphaeraceae archaeon]
MRAILKILVAIDGSIPSFNAADYGLSIAHQFKSELIVLHIIPTLTKVGHSSGVFGLVPKNLSQKSKDEVEKWFVQIHDRAKKLGVPIESNVISTPTSPAREIVKFADQTKVDLIIVATKGLSGIKRMLLGSTAADVVKYASTSVLVAR